MAATDADIARFTSDGVVLTAANKALLDRDSNAVDDGGSERTLFFDDADAGQVMLDELFGFVSYFGKIHEAVETDDGLGLGSSVPLFPSAPQAVAVDATRGIEAVAIVRAYSFDMSTDRYALELVGVAGSPYYTTTVDSTTVHIDNTLIRIDAG